MYDSFPCFTNGKIINLDYESYILQFQNFKAYTYFF